MKTSIYLLIVATLIGFQSEAQCNRSGAGAGTFNQSTCGTFTDILNYSPGTWFAMPVYVGGSYTVHTCLSSMDTQITLYEPPNTTAGTHFAYNDDFGPICGVTNRASVNFVPTFTGFTAVMVSESNCLPGGSASIVVQYRQANNLAFTSSATDMCAGDARALTATPARAFVFQAGAGDQGTFTGTGVSGTTFTAPTPGASQQTYTLTYTFGVCSTTQDITVFRDPSTSDAGTDQTVLTTSTTLAGSTPTFGTGAWTIISGPGTVTTPSSPTSTITGLVPGNTTVVRWTITNGPCTPSLDEVNIHASSGLPIELVNFDAELRDNSVVQLSWETASESDNDYFTVERSPDMENWTEIEEVDGAGNSTTALSYSTIDFNTTAGMWYYRLKQTDFDGTSTYSGVKSVNIYADNEELKIYPNPTNNEINVVGSPLEIETVRVCDLQGKVLNVEKECSLGKCTLKLGELRSGTYLIVTNKRVERVVKK